eukprot:s725_g12.t2
MSPAAPPDGELVEWDSLQPIRKSDDEEEVLPKQKGKELDKGEKNEKNPPKPKKGRRDGQKVDVKKLLEGTEAESAKSVMESEASSSAAQPAQPTVAVPAPGSALYNEAVQNLLNVLGSGGVTKEQVEYSLSRNIEQGMDLTQAADRAYTDLACEGPFGQPNDAEVDAAVEEGSEEEEEEQMPPIDLPELIPQERRPPIPATPHGWQARIAMAESDPYGLKPGKQGRAGGHSHGKGKGAQPPRPINYKRRWDHGKDLDDPVYPTKKTHDGYRRASILVQPWDQPKNSDKLSGTGSKFAAADWRSAGRALLCLGMAMLEGIRLRSKGATLKWQKAGYCNALCQEQCAKSPNRIFCAWRVQNTVHDHHNRLDGALMSYKGMVHYDDPKKPIYRILNQACWSTEHSTFYYYNEERKHSQWEWPLEGVPADMTDAVLERLVTEVKSAAGCTEYKAKVALMETGFSHPAALTLLSDEQKRMEQEADERFQELKLGLKQMHRQQASVDNFLEDLEYVCCESFVCHEEDVCLRVIKGERLKLYYQDPLEADNLKHAGEGWAYVGFKDNEHTHGWIPQECMQVAVRSPKKRLQWQRYKVIESWAAQKGHDIDGFLRVNKGDTIEMLETLEAGACSWVYCFEVESGLAGEIPEHCLE